MIRYSFFLLTVLAVTATAFAAIAFAALAPGRTLSAVSGHNVTVIEKNEAFPVYGPIIVEPCAIEDCSDTPA